MCKRGRDRFASKHSTIPPVDRETHDGRTVNQLLGAVFPLKIFSLRAKLVLVNKSNGY